MEEYNDIDNGSAETSNIPHKSDGTSNIPHKSDGTSNIPHKSDMTSNIPHKSDGTSNIPHKSDGTSNIPHKSDGTSNIPHKSDGTSNIPHKSDGTSNIPHKSDMTSNIPHKSDGTSNIPHKSDGTSNIPHKSDGTSNIPHKSDGTSNIPHKSDMTSNIPHKSDGTSNIPHKSDGTSNIPHKSDGTSNIPHNESGETNMPHSTSDVTPNISQVNECGPPPKKRMTARMQVDGLGFLLASLQKEKDNEMIVQDKVRFEMNDEVDTPSSSALNTDKEEPPVPLRQQQFFEYSHPGHYLVKIKEKFSWDLSNKDRKKETFNNFLKGCKWSPDGTSLLTNSDDRICRVFTFPNQLYECYRHDATFDAQTGKNMSFEESETKLLQSHQYGESVYDFVWYPLMNSANPDSCLYACTGRDHPIHFVNVCDGQLVAVYGARNHLDQLLSCHSICFSNDGHKLIAGLNKSIRIFNVHRPGVECDTATIKTSVYGSLGLNGIISCIKMNPQHNSVFAASTYAKSIGLFDLLCKDPQCVFETEGGITHLAYSQDATKLFAGCRKNCSLTCWDIRNPGRVLYTLERSVDTNQRVYFDTDFYSNYLISGSTSGHVLVWDISKCDEHGKPPLLDSCKVNNACVSAISVNPNLPLLAVGSGQRVFPTPLGNADNDSDSDSDSDSGNDNECNYNDVDNYVKLYWIGENLKENKID